MKHNNNNSCPKTKIITEHPLGDYPRTFLIQLENQNYSQVTITVYMRCINALAQVMIEQKIDIKHLNAEKTTCIINKLKQPLSKKKHTAFIFKRFIEYLTALGVTKSPKRAVTDDSVRGRLKKEYADYLRHQRGLSERTIKDCWRFADRFLKFRFKDELGNLSQITPEDIVKFMHDLLPLGKAFRRKTLPTHLRNFFQFLFKSGKTTINLAPSVPRIAQKYGARLPRHLTPKEVEVLIAAVKTDTPIGRRNYAMALLLSRLGLRATEVIAIQLDDIDWRAGEILVRGKGKLHDRLPLPEDVGKALADYIQGDRATTSRSLFVTSRAPRKPFVDAQIVNTVLKKAFIKTHLNPPTKYVGSHILRHSLATNMLRQGASLEEIGDVLRHRSRSSTAIYAKLDLDGLRTVARPWPVARGVK